MPQNNATKIVLALRQFADWDRLARACDDGDAIAPSDYMPKQDLPFFPHFLPECIAQWNREFSVNFFACRAELQRISRKTLEQVSHGLVVTRADTLRRLPEGDFRLFFLDDDDWFAPDAAARLSCAGDEDVAVFPLFRLGAHPCTYVQDTESVSPVEGPRLAFTFRYHTNNYGLHKRLTTPAMLDMLADHIIASETANRIGLRDAYHDIVLSATNKTPVSVTSLMRMAEEGADYRRHVEHFVAAARGLALPGYACWMEEAVAATARLFEKALT